MRQKPVGGAAIAIIASTLGLLIGVGMVVESRSGETATPTTAPTCAPRYYPTEGAHIVGEMAEVNGEIVDVCE